MDARSTFGTAVGLMQRSAQLMSTFMPGHEWQETRNKLETFRLFAWADQELTLGADSSVPLDKLVTRAHQMDPFESIWVLEGIASHFAASWKPASGMLSQGVGADLPVRALVSMHAGMGTAFSRAMLDGLPAQPSKANLADSLQRFFDLCRANARQGWYENAIEPLGLAVRTMHPHLLRRISDAILEIDQPSQRLFWHGVGRSLYFVPTHFATFGSAHERALETAIREAPGVGERRNAVAGLVWAITLVNLRHTEVLRNLLVAAEKARMPEAVINGITSALMLWKFMTPADSTLLPRYFRPIPGPDHASELWAENVMRPVSRVFALDFPGYLAARTIAPVFCVPNKSVLI